MIKKCTQQPSSISDYAVHDSLFFYKIRLAIPSMTDLRSKLMGVFLASPVAGHLGFLHMYKSLTRHYYWWGLKKDIGRYVAECSNCQRNKYETPKLGGFLQPLPIPQNIWKDVQMDFIDGCPSHLEKI